MKSFFFVLCFLVSVTVMAQEKYSRVKVNLTESHTIAGIAALGLEADHGVRSAQAFETDLAASEIELLKQAGFSYTILIEDVVSYYQKRNADQDKKTRAVNCHPAIPTYTTPSGFNYGSMGGYLTLQEAYNELDSLAAAYPNLVSVKQPIGNYLTVENRPIYVVKISDNVNSNENEPEVLFDAAHHAREVVTVSQIIYFMQYLCENYNSDPEVKRLVDNIEFYFVPVVNPDGYQYNYTTDPAGGGLWRKNRRNNGSNFGVDLNRNYGLGWGFNNIGSSPNTNSSTYRGPSGFSEQETQAMQALCNAHNFVFAANYHSFSNLLIYPWGYTGTNCNDSLYYRQLCAGLSEHNFYKSGTDLETVGYSTNGSSDDWMYGETLTKPKIFAFTPEVGNADDGFWPLQSRILPLCEESNYMNILLSKYVLQYAEVASISPRLTGNLSGHVKYTINRIGLDSTALFTVSLTALTSNVASNGPANTYTNLILGQTYTDSISYTLQNNVSNGEEIKMLLTCSSGVWSTYDTVTLYYGNVISVFSNPCNTLSGWTNNGFAIDMTSYISPTGSIAENATGDYANNTDIDIMTTSLDLSQALRAELVYRCTWEMENSLDYVQVSAGVNGINFNTLCSSLTQPSADPTVIGETYTGVVSDWKYEVINLDDYVGNSSVVLKWQFISDGGLTMRGFNMDDVEVRKLSANPLPVNQSPVDRVQVYPIPVSDKLYITHAEGLSYRLCSATGQVLDAGVYTHAIAVERLPNGLYFIQLNDHDGRVINQKFFIDRH